MKNRKANDLACYFFFFPPPLSSVFVFAVVFFFFFTGPRPPCSSSSLDPSLSVCCWALLPALPRARAALLRSSSTSKETKREGPRRWGVEGPSVRLAVVVLGENIRGDLYYKGVDLHSDRDILHPADAKHTHIRPPQYTHPATPAYLPAPPPLVFHPPPLPPPVASMHTGTCYSH